MTGIFDGLGILLLLSFIFLLYVPLITVNLLRQINLFGNFKNNIRITLYIFLFIILAGLTLVIIRTYKYNSLDGLLIYSLILTVTSFIQWRLTVRDSKSAANSGSK
jgi:hypothetical protein